MSFVEALKPWTAEKIIEIVGCKRRSAYAWKSGEKVPHDWVQGLVLDRMKRVKPDASGCSFSFDGFQVTTSHSNASRKSST